MKLTQLPPVAKSLVTFCSRCQTERFHTVLAHLSAERAKVVCDVCKKKSTFTLEPTNQRNLNLKADASTTTRLNSINKKEIPESFTAIKLTHASSLAEQYEQLKQQKHSVPVRSYRASESYQVGDKLEHKHFGLGFVLKVKDDRMDVLFADSLRQLVCQSSSGRLPL